MKTRCIVNPGRAVRYEGKRHAEGKVLLLGPQDVAQLTKSGDVRVEEAPAPPDVDQQLQADVATATSVSADWVAQAVDAMAAAIAAGELTADDLVAAEPVAPAAPAVPAEPTEPTEPTQAAKRPPAKKAAKARG